MSETISLTLTGNREQARIVFLWRNIKYFYTSLTTGFTHVCSGYEKEEDVAVKETVTEIEQAIERAAKHNG